MKIFFVGDFLTDTGPGVANKQLKKGMEDNHIKGIAFSKSLGKLGRINELFYNSILSDGIIFCGFSKINIVGIVLAKILKKKTYYIMHGYLGYEEEINSGSDNKRLIEKLYKFDRIMFSNVNKIICVSKLCCEFMIKKEYLFKEKFIYNYNGIDIKSIEKENKKNNCNCKQRNLIVSLGGGQKRKNNYTVCKAIEYLNQNKNYNIEYVVIGLPYTDKVKICHFNFVTYFDKMTYSEVLRVLSDCNIYIQNSVFETFCLALFEALFSGCNLLISNNIGSIDCFGNIESNDIIYDNFNFKEIAMKIERLLNKENKARLIAGIKIENIEYKTVAQKLYDIILEDLKGEK